ncbi:MAG: pyridoxamine 5'-phosphate oxidase family protein [Sphingobacteriales bacterium]|jgi:general stress protein 26
MHSNEQSPREDLRGAESIKKLKALAEDARNCMFTTRPRSYPHENRPMSLQHVCDQGNLRFISATDSWKNAAITEDPRVLPFTFRTMAAMSSLQ